jgi:2-amino-4-hydroxy-6-hydroxymethyldihydropteridine diphosphokinase
MVEKNIFLLLGSNLGDRADNLNRGRTLTEKEIGVIRKTSAIYETAAWGKLDQPDFLNQVVRLSSSLSPGELLSKIQSIEKLIGRTRQEKWGERIIDIDILYFGDQLINSSSLVVPHPYLQERRFALVPLAEISPEFIHPLLQKSNTELLKECKDPLAVEKFTS